MTARRAVPAAALAVLALLASGLVTRAGGVWADAPTAQRQTKAAVTRSFMPFGSIESFTFEQSNGDAFVRLR
jgi:hypothetical protein